MRPAALLLIVIALAAGVAQAATPEEELASARPVIEAANTDWVPAMKAHDAKRVAEAYAENGLFILPDGRVIVGRAAIEAATEKRFTPGFKVVSGEIKQDGLGYAAGGLIIEWGHGGLTSTDDTGKTRTAAGPYMTVWKRDGSGQWKIIRNLVF